MNPFLVILMVFSLLFSGCAAPTEGKSPRAVAGVLDLRAWNWGAGVVALDGEWTFDGRPMQVPSGLKFGTSPYGAGTYRLRVLVATSSELAIRLPIIGTAYELLAGDKLLAREGVVSSSAEGAVPSYRPRVVLLPTPADGVLDLQIRVSNWHDQFAGIYYGLTLGPWEQVQAQQDRSALWEALMFGAIFLLGMYFCGSFFFRAQNRAPLWFGVFCLLIAVRSTLYSEVIFLKAFPDASWFLVIRGVYATMSLAFVAFAAFLDRLYPRLSWKLALRFAVAVGGVYALINLAAPISWTTGLLLPFQIGLLGYGVYALVTLGRALRQQESGAGLFATGMVVFLGAIILDIVKNYYFGNMPSLVNVATLVFLMLQALVVARLFARAFASAESHSQDMQLINTSLERFIPREVLGFLGKKSITEIGLGDFSEMQMTVFFLDIRDFTSLSESMSPQQNFLFINSFLKRFGPIIRDHNGFVDKYLGDGMMALFPLCPDDAMAAAVAMRRALVDYNEGRARGGYAAIRFGIGIHTGPLMLGTIGENRRMDSTVISDTVNTASRLEGLNKKYTTDILVSGATLEFLRDDGMFPTKFLALETVKGRIKPVEVFLVVDAGASGD